MADGLNISTGAGNGDAFIDNWSNYHNTLSRIYQEDMLNQRAMQNDYDKSMYRLQSQAAGIRPIDIPQAQKYYDDYRNASLALLKGGLDPVTKAQVIKQKDDAYANYLAHANNSKQTQNLQHSLYQDRLRSNGVDRIDQDKFQQLMNIYDQLPVSEIQKQGLNNPALYTTPHDDTPKDLQKTLYGTQKQIPTYEPVLDANKNKIGDNTKLYSVYENSPAVIADKAAQVLSQSKSQRDLAQNEYEKLKEQDPKALSDLMTKARGLVSGHDLANLHDDAYGYYTAKHMLLGQEKKYVGDGAFKEDPIYKANNDQAFKKDLLADREANTKNNILLRQSIKDAAKGKGGSDDTTINDVYKELDDLSSAATPGKGAPLNSLSATSQKVVLDYARKLVPKDATAAPLTQGDIYIQKDDKGNINIMDAKTFKPIAPLDYKSANQPANSGSVKVRNKINAGSKSKSAPKKHDPLGLF